MSAFPRYLRNTLSILAVMATTHGANADTLFESAEFDAPNGGFLQMQGPEQGMVGARFTLNDPARITGLGGLVRSNGEVFAAIVPLSSPVALPVGSVEELAVAHVVFSPVNFSDDTIAPVDMILPAGNYAVVIGAGAFGATGQFAQLGYGNAAIPNISFVGGNRFGWFERA
ncbi:MAG: hypothetical protein AB8G17_19215, partial [Gammaproteobacteria bacterium]